MTIPNFLSNSFAPFRYYQGTITDINQIIPILRTELTALGWTEPVADTFQCPSDAAGHWMRCAFYKLSASAFRMTVTDQASNTICIRTMLATPPAIITYHTGKFHCYLDSQYSGIAPAYYLAAFLLDTSPDAVASCPYPVVANGSYNSTASFDGYGIIDWWFAVDNGTPGARQRLRGPITYGGIPYGMVMASGRGLFDECLIFQLVGGSGVGNYLWTGRFCQALLGPTFGNIVGDEYRVPIDDGTTGVFRSTPLIYATGSPPYPCRMYMRKS